MRVYSFRLSNVARIRAVEERIAKAQLVAAMKELRIAQDLERSARDALEALQSPCGLISMAEIQWSLDQASRQSSLIGHIAERISKEAARCAERKHEWSEASKRSEVLSKLEAKAFAKWRDEATQEEAAEMDDLTNARYVLGVLS